MRLNVLKICVRGRNEDGSAVLYHAHGQAMVEVIGGIVQLLEHVVDIPLTNQADFFGVDLHKYQRHVTSCAEVAALTSALLKPTSGVRVRMPQLVSFVMQSSSTDVLLWQHLLDIAFSRTSSGLGP